MPSHFRPTDFATMISSLALCGLAATGVHAETAAPKPAEQCLSDLRAFDTMLQKDGYWLHGEGYGYGYPMYGYGSGYAGEWLPPGGTAKGANYWRARPGYEIRTLLATSNILAQRGDQQSCETVLSTTRDLYTAYVATLHADKSRSVDMPSWRRQQIATAVAVTESDTAFRSDELVGASVVNAQGEALGSVDDIVMSPQDGKVAFLVIHRGGIFGIGRQYVPVPWQDFKATPGAKLMVLAAAKADLDNAPLVKDDRFAGSGSYAAESARVNEYWATHLTR